MKKIGVKNFRSLKEITSVDVKPITVLVGRNSSGKSSFIRIIPLIKQSVETKISEPLLWYGDFVDLGEFEECLAKGADIKEDEIEFYLATTMSQDMYYRGLKRENADKAIDVSVKFAVRNNVFSKVEINYIDQRIQIFYGKNETIDSVLVNGSDVLNRLLQGKKYYREPYSLIPSIAYSDKEGHMLRLGRYGYWRTPNIFDQEIVKKLKEKAFVTTKEETLHQTIKRVFVGSKNDILESLKQLNFPNMLHQELRKLSIEDKYFMELNNLFVANSIGDIIEMVNYAIRLEMRTVRYIKPIRASVERYYRVQGLSIDELDSSGENLPMLLHGLKPEVRKKFERWVADRFGVSFTLVDRKGHISLLLKDIDTDETYNLADVGYGYSQVLPILMQIWLEFYDEKNYYEDSKTSIIIEQPELHLHPAFQAKLIDIFAEMLETSRKINKDLKIIFETHSETMIQRLGYLIAKGYLNEDDVNVLVFDKNKNETNIMSKKYTKEGLLKEWPSGFFTPEKKTNKKHGDKN